MDVRDGFVLAGVVLGLLVTVLNELRRHLRLRRRRRFEAESRPTIVEIESITTTGRNDSLRHLELSYLDEAGTRQFVESTVHAVEANAIGLWAGAAVAAHVKRDDPSDVQLDRPSINDDRPWVSIALGVVMFGALVAAGSMV